MMSERGVPGRPRRGLIVLASDPAGRTLAEAVATTARGDERVHCHAWVNTVVADGDPPWSTWRPGEGWQPSTWLEEVGSWAEGVDAGIREAFRDTDDEAVAESRREPLDAVDIAFLLPQRGNEQPPGKNELITLLPRLRRQFRRLERIFAVACERFEIVGASGLPGLVDTLPRLETVEAGAIDFVLLHDQVNLEDRWAANPAEQREAVAKALLHVTVGPFALKLYELLQAERERLGVAGRYLAVGTAEWSLAAQGGVEAAAELLFARMAAALAQAAKSPEPMVLLPPDLWLGEELPTPKENESEVVRHEIERRAEESLKELFRSTGSRLGVLQALLARRLEALGRLEARRKLELADFMECFAAWYSRLEVGEIRWDQAPTLVVAKVPDYTRIALVVLACLGVVGAGVAAWLTQEKLWSVTVSAVFLGLALFLATRGFKRTLTTEVPPAIPEDLRPELTRRRAALWIVQQLVGWHARARQGLAQRLTLLEAISQAAPEPSAERFPFTRAVCLRLLENLGLQPNDCLKRFWKDRPGAWDELFLEPAEGSGLLKELKSFALESCQPLSQLQWKGLVAALGVSSADEDPAWERGSERLRKASLPWMPIAGRSLWSAMFLPQELPRELAESLARRIGSKGHPLEGAGGGVVVVQVSQGYESNSTNPS